MNYVLSESDRAKLNRLLRTKPGNTFAARPPRSASLDRFPAPFTVRWSASEVPESGTWVIWLPDVAKLFAFGGEYSTITGVSPCEHLPAGWYTISDSSGGSDTEVWLNVSMSGDVVARVELSVAEGVETTGETVWAIPIATMSTDEETSAKSVKQFVDSAVHLGGGGSIDNSCWAISVQDSQHVFINQYYLEGEVAKALELLDTVESFVAQGLPFVCLKIPAVTATTETPTLVGYETFGSLEGDSRDPRYIIKPLYKFGENCNVLVDFRNMPSAQMGEMLA